MIGTAPHIFQDHCVKVSISELRFLSLVGEMPQMDVPIESRFNLRIEILIIGRDQSFVVGVAVDLFQSQN